MTCKICGSAVTPLFARKVLSKHQVSYFRCPTCGFIQTEEPYWLEEAYGDAISALDIGTVSRAVKNSRIVESLILSSFSPDAKYMDWGAGYGLLVRMMRDQGYDYYWRDPHCENLFARQFVADDRRFELMTSFEVFEHMVDPVQSVSDMLHQTDSIFFSTSLVPESGADDWWYIAPQTGQHISFFTTKSLEALGHKFDLSLYTDGREYHLLTRRPISSRAFSISVRDGRLAMGFRKVQRRLHHKGTLLNSDFASVTGWDL